MECNCGSVQIFAIHIWVLTKQTIECDIRISAGVGAAIPKFVAGFSDHNYPSHHERPGLLDSRQFPKEELVK